MNKQNHHFYHRSIISENGNRLFFDEEDKLIGEFETNPEIFKVGKAYQHTSGKQLFICGESNTIAYGNCLIAECGWNKKLLKLRHKEILKDNKENGAKLPSTGLNTERFTPISRETWATANYFEIPVKEFIANNFE